MLRFLQRGGRFRKFGLNGRQAKGFARGIRAEEAATLAGFAAFRSHKTETRRSYPLLRRNIHRLEKGLCFPERKAVFGEAFIGETVALYAKLAKAEGAAPGELRWARDVLAAYFEVVDTSAPVIAAARDVFLHAGGGDVQGDARHAPYALVEMTERLGVDRDTLCDIEAFQALCTARRSQRWFLDTPVPLDGVERAVAAALQAPSACNRQPFQFHLARTPELVRKIADLPLGTKGFGHDLPALVAVVGDLSMYAEPRDRHLIFVDAALAAMQFMLAITAQRLGSVPINWPDIPANHQALREILGLQPYQVPIMLIGIGVPDPNAAIAYSAKRSVDEVLHVAD